MFEERKRLEVKSNLNMVSVLMRHPTTLLVIIIIIITLFRENNVLRTSVSLTCSPRLQYSCIYDVRKFNLYEQMRSPYTEHVARGFPSLLTWKGRYDLSRFKTSRLSQVVRDGN